MSTTLDFLEALYKQRIKSIAKREFEGRNAPLYMVGVVFDGNEITYSVCDSFEDLHEWTSPDHVAQMQLNETLTKGFASLHNTCGKRFVEELPTWLVMSTRVPQMNCTLFAAKYDESHTTH